MDAETERELAALIMEEASRLRVQAERDGVAAYLAKPSVRGRPNPRFLQATVRSIQQANRIAEVNEMWRRRAVELEYEGKSERISRRDKRQPWSKSETTCEPIEESRNTEMESLHRRVSSFESMGDDGWKDSEMEQFLHSRVKRGRGAVGSRMDEAGPYLPAESASMPVDNPESSWNKRSVGCSLGGIKDEQMKKSNRKHRTFCEIVEDPKKKKKHKATKEKKRRDSRKLDKSERVSKRNKRRK